VPMPLYLLGPLEGLRIRRLIDRIARYQLPFERTWSSGQAGLAGEASDASSTHQPTDGLVAVE